MISKHNNLFQHDRLQYQYWLIESPIPHIFISEVGSLFSILPLHFGWALNPTSGAQRHLSGASTASEGKSVMAPQRPRAVYGFGGQVLLGGRDGIRKTPYDVCKTSRWIQTFTPWLIGIEPNGPKGCSRFTVSARIVTQRITRKIMENHGSQLESFPGGLHPWTLCCDGLGWGRICTGFLLNLVTDMCKFTTKPWFQVDV